MARTPSTTGLIDSNKEPTFWLVSLRWSSDKFSKDEASFNPGAQIATRVMSVVPGEDNVFKQFAWSCIKTFADAMIELGEKPSLKSLSQNINKGIEDLLRALILLVVKQHADPDWREQAESFLPARRENCTDAIHELNVLVSWYENVLPTYLHTMVVGECLMIFHIPDGTFIGSVRRIRR